MTYGMIPENGNIGPRSRRSQFVLFGNSLTSSKTIVFLLYVTTVTCMSFFIVISRDMDVSRETTDWPSLSLSTTTVDLLGRSNTNDEPRSFLWSNRLALSRATIDAADAAANLTDAVAASTTTPNTMKRYAAIMIQVSNIELWDDMLTCVANVAAAVPDGFALDVYVSYSPPRPGDNSTMLRTTSPSTSSSSSPSKTTPIRLEDRVRESLKPISRIGQLYISRFGQSGADISQFLKQLQSMMIFTAGKVESDYEVILKMHTKGDNAWRQRNLESLCGTPEQVKSVWNQFNVDRNLAIIAPHGTAFGPYTPTAHIFPHISRKYLWLDQGVTGETRAAGPQVAFDETTIKNMRELQTITYGQDSAPFSDDHLTIIAGSAYWIRKEALEPEELMKILKHFYGKVAKGDAEIRAMEYATERLIPTWAVANGRGIALIPPAPRVVAFYDPKYTPEYVFIFPALPIVSFIGVACGACFVSSTHQ
jgi:hypothetical protein